MRSIILAGAAALAFAVPAVAQDTTTQAETQAEAETAMGPYTMTAGQQTSYDAWPADRQAAYDAWTAEIQEYFWSLTPEQQTGWWALTDEQRTQVYRMTPQQRTSAWAQISAQMSGSAAPGAAASTTAAATAAPPTSRTAAGPASTTGAMASSGDMRFVESETVQTAPPPKEEYPLCSAEVQDGCVNPRAAGKNYGNVPLDYWPGKPASEIDEPLPAKKPDGA